MTYIIPCECGENGLTVFAPQYRGGLIRVTLDGKEAGRIVYAPYRLDIPAEAGKHELRLTVYGNRVNSFGALHQCNTSLTWHGPGAWETKGREFSYEYRLKECGLLIAPRLYK